MGNGTLTKRIILCVAMCIVLVTPANAGETKAGENIEPVIEDTIFSEITHTEVTTDLEDWEISMTLNDDAYANNTSFILMTQICNNEGVCFAPEEAIVSTLDNRTFTSAVTTVEDHSYVNWRVKATYVDENESTEMFPSSGFYKTWSDCWYKDGEWGGGNCPDDAENGDSLPAIGFVAATSIALIAAIIRRE